MIENPGYQHYYDYYYYQAVWCKSKKTERERERDSGGKRRKYMDVYIRVLTSPSVW